MDAAVSALAELAQDRPAVEGTIVHAPVRARTGIIPDAVRRLDGAGVGIVDIVLRRPTLDDVFIALTGHAAEEGGPKRSGAGGGGMSSLAMTIEDTMVLAQAAT